MNWAHLPVQGGIYDQHPDLIEDFETIFSIQAKIEDKKSREQQAKAKTKGRK